MTSPVLALAIAIAREASADPPPADYLRRAWVASVGRAYRPHTADTALGSAAFDLAVEHGFDITQLEALQQ